MTKLPDFTMRDLLDAGVHFGHRTMRWNPRMEPYLFGARNNIHIIDLQKTAPMLYRALKIVNDVVSKNGRVLFVGTKMQASSIVSDSAKRCGQYYVNHRWLGGMLTNWNTVSASIRTLRSIEDKLASAETTGRLTKKEVLVMTRKHEKLERALGGIRDMGGRPDLLFVIDTNREKIAIQEAKRLGIPVIGIVDSNANPEDVTYPIPGNDDAARAIKLYCRLMSDAVLSGIQDELVLSGTDVGASIDVPAAKLEVVAAAPAPAAPKAVVENAVAVADLQKAAEALGAVEVVSDAKPAAEKKAAKKPAAKKAAPKKAEAEAEEKKSAAKKPAVKKKAAPKKADGAA